MWLQWFSKKQTSQSLRSFNYARRIKILVNKVVGFCNRLDPDNMSRTARQSGLI